MLMRRRIKAGVLPLGLIGILCGLLLGIEFAGKKALAQRGEVAAQPGPRPAQQFPPEQPPGPITHDLLASKLPAAYRPELRRYPYLTNVVGANVTVNWATDRSASTGSVTWGRAGVEPCTAYTAPAIRTNIIITPVLAYQWTAPLTLTANTEYCYRVFLDATDLLDTDPSPQFRTQLPAGNPTPFSFAVFGDWGEVDANGQNPDQANVMAQLAASEARFALTTGDNGYPSGSQSNYGDLYQVGPNLSGVFGPLFWTVPGDNIPLFPAIGNHGFDRADVYHPHLLHWPQDHAVATSGGRYLRETYCCVNGTHLGEYPSVWYAFDAGVARFYVLETAWDDGNPGTASSYENDYATHWTPSSPQYQWLEQDLRTHPSLLKFAVFHYPLYSDQSLERSDIFLQGPASLEGLLSRHGVNIAFSGHGHLYQRNRKLAPHGLINYVTGGGGARLQPIGAAGCSPENAYGIGWSYTTGQGSACGAAPVPAAPAQVYHFLLVSVDGPRVTVAPTDSLGRTFDVQAYDFTPPTPTPTVPPPTPCPVQFTDVDPTNPFYAFVRCLACRQIVSGYADGTFRPGASVTRGQLAKILASAAGLSNNIPSTQQTFSDVPNTNPFWLFAERLAATGAIAGYACGGPGEPCDPQRRPYFRWGANATRGQIAKITAVTAGWNGPIPPPLQTFSDVPNTNPFRTWIEELAFRQIISGYGCGGPGEPCDPANRPYFRWGANATRGQMSKIAANAFYPNCQTPAWR
jgi:hypothetical protein